MLSAAKKLYDMGFAIHLLKPKSKMPIESKWSTGPRKSWDQLSKNFRPGLNVGCRLGTASKLGEHYLAVIDCDVKSEDPRHSKEMEKKLSVLLNGVEPAPIVWSGRGNKSRHVYVKTKKPVSPRRLSQSKDHVECYMPSVKPSRNDEKALSAVRIKAGYRLRPAWEISLMGEGQQVVVPPSIHPDSGKPYIWDHRLHLSVQGIPLASLGDGDSEKAEKTKLNDFRAVEVDLISSSLNDEMVSLIIDGEGCMGDKSASVFKACLAMSGAGFSDLEILSVLTDEENYLGDVGYRHANTSSRKRAAEWIKNFGLSKARKKTSADRFFSEPAFHQKLSNEDAKTQEKKILGDTDWRAKISRAKNSDIPHPSFKNIKLILNNGVGRGLLARNVFAVEDIWLKDCPWGSKKDAQVTDTDSIKIKDWLTHHWRMEPGKERIDEVLVQLASENEFHPVRDYLDGLHWDGVLRLETWLKDYLKALGPKEYLKSIGTKTLLAMVARIYEPGIKFDNVLILEGIQGIGKSSTARILAGDKWFSDTEFTMGDKDAVINMQGIWVYELGELSAMSRYDVNRIKEFVSRSTDKIRPPYGRRLVAYPRQCVFIGTTNNDEYLKDQTGNRRYWPVKCEGTILMRRLERDRDQLLAEAKELYMLGEDLWIKDIKTREIAAREQQLRVETDVLQESINDFLNNNVEDFNPQQFRILELMEKCDAVSGLKNDRATQMRVANSLKNLGYKKERKMINKNQSFWWSKKVCK